VTLLKKLLLIDDDEIFVFLTRKSLDEIACFDQINVCHSSKDAIDFLSQRSNKPEQLPEIILLDLSMPITDGWGFLVEYMQLKEKLCKQINLYIMSSSISPYDIEKAKSISAVSGFIIKPIAKEKVADIVKS
jgi:CheY-like chemotaxis protein